jgi:sulfoxide reductase heme-binding subunit YedZ
MMRRAGKALVFVVCLTPMAVIWANLFLGNIRGEWIKTVTHQTGQWGLGMIVATLAITPLRRVTGWNGLQRYRRMLGLFAFFYVFVHFLVIYVVLDKQLPFDPAIGWGEILKDIAKRPYITVGFAGFVLLIPLAVTSTRGWVRRLGKRWVTLHSLIYVTALAGVVHYAWAVKADLLGPTLFGLAIGTLLLARLLPSRPLPRKAVSNTGM